MPEIVFFVSLLPGEEIAPALSSAGAPPFAALALAESDGAASATAEKPAIAPEPAIAKAANAASGFFHRCFGVETEALFIKCSIFVLNAHTN